MAFEFDFGGELLTVLADSYEVVDKPDPQGRQEVLFRGPAGDVGRWRIWAPNRNIRPIKLNKPMRREQPSAEANG